MNAKKFFATLMMAGFLALQTSVIFAQSNEIKSNEQSDNIVETFGKSDRLEGSWLVMVTPNGGPPPFRGLITFDSGGGLIASAQGDILLNPPPGVPPVATAGHGAWKRTGNRRYAFSFRQLLYDSVGNYQGEVKSRHRITVNAAGNQWNGQLLFEIFDADGHLVFSDSATEQATRIEVEPF
ncbi:hypothetical protein BH20ACI1_BH20ACI1_06510 [soil metagenome]